MPKNQYFNHEGPWSDATGPLMCTDTGDWRTKRPVVDAERCIFCGFCAIYCPIQVVQMKGESHFEADLGFCKGCGICAQECPKNAISMVSEEEFQS
ncbi:MAG TPA: pyruvate ferredoxin oxidoreductase [Desulfobacteraceae bacterium]|nr:pyruvate ferredoxin oxidoreductase [Desulfobacteraceae bacterium]|tara:strand:+ start:536 stop:823 length:288 start_codon:yes stop_codon:yes gene_type:complete